MKITGKATIRVNGAELVTAPGATLNPGGAKRNPVAGVNHIDFNEENVPPEMSCKVHHRADVSMTRLRDKLVGATVRFECDNGTAFLLRNAFTTDVPSLDSKEGMVDLKMSAEGCEEV